MNSTSPFIIRVAATQDMEQIRDIWLDNLHVSFDPSIPSPNVNEAEQYWTLKLREQNDVYPIWVAEDETGVLGFLALSPMYSGHPVLNAVFGETSLYIGKGHQGRGIGPQLLKKAVSHCDSSPLKFILGTTSVVNFPSQKTLQRLGFQKMGMLPASDKAPQLPALLYFFYAAKVQDSPFNLLSMPELIAV